MPLIQERIVLLLKDENHRPHHHFPFDQIVVKHKSININKNKGQKVQKKTTFYKNISGVGVLVVSSHFNTDF